MGGGGGWGEEGPCIIDKWDRFGDVWVWVGGGGGGRVEQSPQKEASLGTYPKNTHREKEPNFTNKPLPPSHALNLQPASADITSGG